MKSHLVALALAACSAGAYRTLAQEGRATPPLPADSSRSLFAQSAGQILNREFSGDDVSFLLLDARSGALISSRWAGAERPIPLGSLVKPFTALAYAQHHEYHYPTYRCHGSAGGCWQPHSHGRLDISYALALSCNSYFRELASGLNAGELQQVATQFGLEPPDSRLAGPPLMGVGDEWPISPKHMAQAYLELVRRRDEPGVREILAGLADSAEWGTGSGVGRAFARSSALVKTGTAICRHAHHAPGDGFAVALSPADSPELLLMVGVHGSPGSAAAAVVGRMLARIEP